MITCQELKPFNIMRSLSQPKGKKKERKTENKYSYANDTEL